MNKNEFMNAERPESFSHRPESFSHRLTLSDELSFGLVPEMIGHTFGPPGPVPKFVSFSLDYVLICHNLN